MLKREVTYEDFNGQQVTETLYFNLSRTELIDLESSYEGGLEARMRRIVDDKDGAGIMAEFQKILLLAYGHKSEDGKRFIKTDQDRELFKQSAAYDELFIELVTDADKAVEFIQALIPKGVPEDQDKPPLPPPSQ